MAAKIKKINESMMDIDTQAQRELALKRLVTPNSGISMNSQPNRVTDRYLDKSETPTGRKGEVEKIMNMLQESLSPVPTVIAIVGIGGLGKTTLAKLIVEEVRKKQLFDETMWVCVSDTSHTFDDQKVLKGMLETLDISTGGSSNIDAILQHLQKKLEKKRFLLVLDDVWNEWVSFKQRLQNICSTNGSFVIFTTREKRLANVMETSAQHMVELEPLLDVECWLIIREKVLGKGGELLPKELEATGIEIAKKCGGLPLVAKVLGGTLRSSRRKEEWLSIRDSEVWKPNGQDNNVLSVLRLSFDRLQPSVKSCFAYCSVFPKDFVYSKQQLIELWMAEGFLDSTSTNESSSVTSMEGVGDQYFNELLAHSLFQDPTANKWGNIINCKMHDLLHDLAESVSNNRKLRLTDGSNCILRASSGQHLSDENLVKDGATIVRSLFSKDVVSHMFCDFTSLRSLDISLSGIRELSAAIGRLKHLRYLDISRNYFTSDLPEAITKLYNLQTLRMNYCWIVRLPNKMINLVSLRHIHSDMSIVSIYKVGCLIGLRTLPSFLVGIEKGFKIEELEGLNDLTGELLILGLNNVKDGEEAKKANLKEKKLSELSLQWSDPNNFSGNYNYEDVLEGLLPPPSIKSLAIRNYRGKQFPNWMSMRINRSMSPLKALMELSLEYCLHCERMPSLGHLPHLKTLKIKSMDDLRCIGSEFYGEINRTVSLFPALEEFSLWRMQSLVEWAIIGSIERGIVFPCLVKLVIFKCPRLRSIPLIHLSSLVSLRIVGCRDMEYLSNEGQNLSFLQNLEIEFCASLVSLSSLQSIRSLKEMRIVACPKVISLPQGMKFCKSLQSLNLSYCESLICIDDEIISSLPQLRALTFGPFSKELEEFPGLNSIHHLCNSSLEYLEINGWDKLKSLPRQLQHLTVLKHLKVSYFRQVETFPNWLGEFSSLQRLKIFHCDQLKDLPTTMKRLSNLTELTILDCPLLKERYKYKVREGPDWTNISHIPRIFID